MKILFLTSRLPFPPIGGDKVRTFHFIKHLNSKHDLTIISFIQDDQELACLPDFKQYYQKIITIRLPRYQSYWNCLKGLFSRKPLQVHYYFSKKMRQVVKNELADCDIIFCHLIRMAQYLPKENHVRKIVDFTDAISLNYDRSKKYRKGLFSWVNLIESSRVFKYENRAITHADASIFISDTDAAHFRKNGNIKIVNNGVDFQKFNFYNTQYNKKQIAFLGNMRTFPNTDAVIYFVNDILPLLQSVEPDVCFYIIGMEPSKEVRRLHDGKTVIVTGYVDDIKPLLSSCLTMVAPMRTGAGMQNKMLESLALGTPIVTTNIGAEGLDKSFLLIGDTPGEISSAIIRLMQDDALRKEYARRGRQYVEERFTWNVAFEKLDAIMVNNSNRS